MQTKLNVIYINNGETETFELYANTIKEVLSLLRLQKDAEFVDNILNNQYKFILMDTKNPENAIALTPEVIFSEFTGFDSLIILNDISGEEPISVGLTAAALWTASVTGLSVATATLIINTIALSALMMGLNMLMQALSPTPEFSSDPAATQNKSNLFNGAPLIRDQGGIMPLVFGNPYCGTVLISSGVFSEEVAV